MRTKVCPIIRAGVTEYNKGSLSFDNGSRIISATTTENTGRGMPALVYLDEFVPASEFWTSITLIQVVSTTHLTATMTLLLIFDPTIREVDEHGNESNVGTNGFSI